MNETADGHRVFHQSSYKRNGRGLRLYLAWPTESSAVEETPDWTL